MDVASVRIGAFTIYNINWCKSNEYIERKHTYMNNNKYNLSEIENIEDLPEDAEVVLDDKPRKYDIKNRKIVKHGEPGYDDLPEIKY